MIRLKGGLRSPTSFFMGSEVSFNLMIKSLFKDGSVGGYWNLQDPSSRLDNGLIPDLSGQGNAWGQTNPASKPPFIQNEFGYWSLKFDGVDDSYVTPSIDFSKTDKVTIIAAIRKLSDADAGIVAELSSNYNVNSGVFSVAAPGGTSTGNRLSFRTKSTIDRTLSSGDVYAAPTSVVMTCKSNISNKYALLRANSTNLLTSTLDQGVGNYGNYPLYIGRRGGTSLPFNGQIYALLVIGKLLDEQTTAKIEKEFAKYIGVTL